MIPVSLPLSRPRRRAGNGAQRGGDDVAVEADAEEGAAVRHARLDIGGSLRVRPGAQRMLAVIEDLQLGDAGALQRVDEGVDGPVAGPFDDALAFRRTDRRREGAAPSVRNREVINQGDPVLGEIGLLEARPDLGRARLLAAPVRPLLDDAAELDLQAARKVEPVILLEEIGDAALARLAVGAD